MPVPSDSKLYEAVKRRAMRRFDRWPSAYGSAYLDREYRRLGGKYKRDTQGARRTWGDWRATGQAGGRPAGIQRWMREEWVQVGPAVAEGHEGRRVVVEGHVPARRVPVAAGRQGAAAAAVSQDAVAVGGRP